MNSVVSVLGEHRLGFPFPSTRVVVGLKSGRDLAFDLDRSRLVCRATRLCDDANSTRNVGSNGTSYDIMWASIGYP